MRLSDISSKTGKNAFFVFLGCFWAYVHQTFLSFQADKRNLFCTFNSSLAKLGRNQVDSTFWSAQMVYKLLETSLTKHATGPKGQMISKRHFDILGFFQKKWTNKFVFITVRQKKTKSFVRFLEESEDTKSRSEIIWALKAYCSNIYTVMLGQKLLYPCQLSKWMRCEKYDALHLHTYAQYIYYDSKLSSTF